MPAGIHKQVSCKICYKTMRSNNASRHMKIHIIHTNENNALMCRELLDEMLDKVVEHVQPTRKRKLDADVTEDNHPTSKRKCGENMTDVDELRKMLIERTDKYNRTIALGEQVYKILGEGEVKQGALPKDMQEALELYEKENNDFDLYKDTALYPWQQECMKHINNKSDREVYWIVGQKTNEGKSFFQKYVKAMYGTSRVVSGINLKASSKNICHALTKQPLATADIFLFNLGKSKKNFENVNYEMLEDLKDGDAFTEKYNSQKLKIKTPNVVMVFSNYRPQPGELALDRWKVFDIVDDHLEAAIPVDNKINHCWITKKKKK